MLVSHLDVPSGEGEGVGKVFGFDGFGAQEATGFKWRELRRSFFRDWKDLVD